MITVQKAILMVLAAAAGGLIQSVCGFGAGIVMMMFIPYFLPILSGSAVSSLVSIPLQLVIIFTYRKYIRWDYLIKPIVFYMPLSFIAIRLAVGKDVSVIKLIFGCFLVVLAIYFFLFSKKASVKPGWGSAALCGGISGVSTGLFGIGGPPMALYFMAITEGEKLTYLATLQIFFTITGIFANVVRVFSGILTLDLVSFIAFGVAGILIGHLFGKKIVDKINADMMRKIVYAFVGIAGIINVITTMPQVF